MLFRKTFGNALATLLGMALALATGVAHAQDTVPASRYVNLDAQGTQASPYGTALIARETLISGTAGVTSVGGTTYYNIDVPGDQLRVRGSLGVTGTDTRQLFVRLDLEGAVFRTQLTDGRGAANRTNVLLIPDRDHGIGGVNTVDNDIAREAGGQVNGTSVVYSLPTDGDGAGGYTSNAQTSWALHDKLAVLSTGARVTQTTYVDLGDALRGTGSLATRSAPVVAVVPSLRSSVTAGASVVTTVDSGFTQLQSAGANLLGSLTHIVGGGQTGGVASGQAAHWDARADEATAVTTLAGVITEGNAAGTFGSLITLTGDFSVGSFTQATVAVPNAASCAGGTGLTTLDASRQPRESVSFAPSLGTTAICMNVPVGNAGQTQVQAGSYMVSVDYRGLPNAAFEPTDVAETAIGRIVRNGTRVHIPYLTIDPGYNQRVVIVNRNAGDVQYAFSFTAEGDTETMGLDAAQGMVPGESTMVIRATDIVSIEGRNRTAATIDVVATAGSVDIATTQVNRDTGGTDTVVYDNVAGTGL